MTERHSHSGLSITGPSFSLHAEAGSITLLRGDVGSGKSIWLERLAGLQPLPPDVVLTHSGNQEPVVRMLFDRNPPLWLGQSIGEELCFGLSVTPTADAVAAVMRNWRLDDLDLHTDVLNLNRLQSIRLSLAAMDLAGPGLALLDSPADGLPVSNAEQLMNDIDAWAQRSDCIVVVASNRWQGWQIKASQIWRTTSPLRMPELDSGEA